MKEFEERNRVIVEGKEFMPEDADTMRKVEGFRIGYREAQSRRNSIKEKIDNGKPKVVILGSFKFKENIDTIIDLYTADGIDVLAPKKGDVIGDVGEFKLLEGDEAGQPADLWANFLHNITQADAIYIYAQDGYIGDTVQAEIMFVSIVGIPMYTLEPIKREITDVSKRSITSAIKKISPTMFTAVMKSTHGKDVNVEGQFWCKTKKERQQEGVQVFGFTDHTGERAIFVDFT